MKNRINDWRKILGIRMMLWPIKIMPKCKERDDYALFMAAYFDWELLRMKAEKEASQPGGNVIKMPAAWGKDGKPRITVR